MPGQSALLFKHRKYAKRMFNNWNIAFWEYEFFAPYWLLLLLFIPFMWWYSINSDKKTPGNFKFSRTTSDQEALGDNNTKYLRWIVVSSYSFVACMLIFALARPFNQRLDDDLDYDLHSGIDIVMALDISSSMLARDFSPNRLEVAKKVAKQFVEGRKGDRIGLVVYEGEAFTACPATLDYSLLTSQIDQLQSGMLKPGTAIGVGLGTAVTRLRSDSLQSKVIILLTDGVSVHSEITPETAAQLAKAKGIKVYTIGVGSEGTAPYPEMTPFGVRYVDMPVEIDEVTLRNIAQITGGKYFRATDEASLRSIYKEIDLLEKRAFEALNVNHELPAMPLPFLSWALVIGIVAWSIQLLYFRTNG
ncbi:MAG: VWA domain-containing protein [Crocinitomicaceae bacterium]|nr:MAG: VWA domain-containing protein [Crocinitomicaceae bacterium]